MTVNNAASNFKDAQGTVIITGANGSLGSGFVKNLLKKYPGYFTILAVRNDSDDDPNTLELRRIVSGFSDANVSIEAVDLASFASVRSFADSINSRVANGTIPHISALVCNAFIWSLVDQKISGDGFELGFQTSHLSHFLLVLKLIGSMDKEAGRIVFLGSIQIMTPTTSQNPLGAELPANLDELVTSPPDKKGEEQIRGFQRYVWSKMANTMCMEMLNRKLLVVRPV
jgi:NAD(P)-dependent dehydrogenase (short-subunit alcohol dehydrogenase family)